MIRRLAYDALFLDPGVSGGPETVMRGLLPAIAAADPAVEITIAASGRGARALRADGWSDWARILALPAEDDTRVRKLYAQQLMLDRLAGERGWEPSTASRTSGRCGSGCRSSSPSST